MLLGPPKDNLLRQRCDARGFEPLPIEIIAEQKVALAFEAQKLLYVDDRRWRRETGAPGRACRVLFGDLGVYS
jgi:hypothetical protein